VANGEAEGELEKLKESCIAHFALNGGVLPKRACTYIRTSSLKHNPHLARTLSAIAVERP